MNDKKLRYLYIYLTESCNLKCLHCFQSNHLEPVGRGVQLRFEKCRRFLDDAIRLGLQNVTLSGGEPLLNPDFPAFASYLRQNNIHIAMETNGILIQKPKNIAAIKENNVFCAISLDGLSPEIHNKQRASNTAHKKTLESIRILEEARCHYEIIIALSRLNAHELFPLMDWIRENLKYCATFKINPIVDYGRAQEMKKDGILFNPREYAEIGEQIGQVNDRYSFQIALHLEPVFLTLKNLKRQFNCGGHCGFMSALSILANGNVSICSMGVQFPSYIFGRVESANAADIWNHCDILTDIHQNIPKKLKGVCGNCIFRKMCYGSCRGNALIKYGDIFAPNPSCQSYHDMGFFPKTRLIDPDKNSAYPTHS